MNSVSNIFKHTSNACVPAEKLLRDRALTADQEAPEERVELPPQKSGVESGECQGNADQTIVRGGEYWDARFASPGVSSIRDEYTSPWHHARCGRSVRRCRKWHAPSKVSRSLWWELGIPQIVDGGGSYKRYLHLNDRDRGFKQRRR
ncbi:MAG: hypothetical protein Aurels2KO_42820 [Aureliella sp.]